MKKEDIINAYVRMREIDHTIPSDVLEFMKDSAIAALADSPSLENSFKGIATPERTTMQEAYDSEGAIYLITLDKREGFAVGSKSLGHCIAEIQDSDAFVGGDPGSFTNDSNINFDSIQQAEDYYNRDFAEVMVFIDEDDRNEMVDIMEREGLWKK